MNKQRPTLEEPLQSLHKGSLGSSRDLKAVDPIEPTPMLVTIDKIKEYDHNPRRERNPAYELIKESIRQRGFAGALAITRRPGEPVYMVAAGGNTVLNTLKALYAETQASKFYTIHCLFEPWVSESETLIAHLVENDTRGELIFIDRARAAHELRALLQQETGMVLSNRDLATRLRAYGYTLDPASLAKMDYAVDKLFPCIPVAFRAGLGLPQVERIRTLESIFIAFLEDRKQGAAAVEEARQWFFGCLARHDGEDLVLTLEPVQREIEVHAAEICNGSVAKVRADFGFIEATGRPGHDAPPPVPFSLREREASKHRDIPGQTGDGGSQPSSPSLPVAATTTRSSIVEAGAGAEVDDRGKPGVEESPAYEVFEDTLAFDEVRSTEEAELEQTAHPRPGPSADAKQHALPQDVKSLGGRMWTLATQLAQRHGLGTSIRLCPKGCGFIVDLPDHPLYAGEHPESAEEAQRVTLWWMLAALADEWPYGIDQAPALQYLKDVSIYPAIRAVAKGDVRTASDTLMSRVSFPPSLDLAARQLFAVLYDRDYARLIQLIDTRRALQAHCRRLGKRIVWEI